MCSVCRTSSFRALASGRRWASGRRSFPFVAWTSTASSPSSPLSSTSSPTSSPPSPSTPSSLESLVPLPLLKRSRRCPPTPLVPRARQLRSLPSPTFLLSLPILSPPLHSPLSLGILPTLPLRSHSRRRPLLPASQIFISLPFETRRGRSLGGGFANVDLVEDGRERELGETNVDVVGGTEEREWKRPGSLEKSVS